MQWESALFLLEKIGIKSSRPQTWIAEVAGSIRDVPGSLTQTLTVQLSTEMFVGEHACSLSSTVAVWFHNWPKLTYSWAPARRQLSLSADSCAPLAVGSVVPGADWSRCNPPLPFFPPFGRVNFQLAHFAELADSWGGHWSWHKEMARGAGLESASLAFLPSVWAEPPAQRAVLCSFCSAHKPQMPWEEGRTGHCLRMGWMQILLCSSEHREKGIKNYLLKNGAMRKTHLIYMQAWGFPVVFRPEVFTVLPSSYATKLQMCSVQPMH